MNTTIKIGGTHHITAIASSASENLAFYEDVLGLRLVKKTRSRVVLPIDPAIGREGTDILRIIP